MHILRAKNGDYDTTTPSALDFLMGKIKKDSYSDKDIHKVLISKESFIFIKQLANFWINPYDYFSETSKKYFDILSKYQNEYWKIPVSMCIWEFRNKDSVNELEIDEKVFDELFPKLITFITIALINGKGTTSSLKGVLYKANVEIHKNKKIIFQHNFENLIFEDFLKFCLKTQAKNIRYLLVLYTYLFDLDQKREWDWEDNKSKIKRTCVLDSEIEHILPKAWQNANFNGWNEEIQKKYLEQIGNKMLLEKPLNIKCGDDFFANKKITYRKSGFKEAQKISREDKKIYWLKEDIEARNEEIYERLKAFFEKNL